MNKLILNIKIPEELKNNNIIDLTEICSEWYVNFETFVIKSLIKIIIIFLIMYFLEFYTGKNKIINRLKRTSKFVYKYAPVTISMIIIDYYIQNLYNIPNYYYSIIITIIMIIITIKKRKEIFQIFKYLKENL